MSNQDKPKNEKPTSFMGWSMSHKGFSTGTIECYTGFNQFGFKLSKAWSSKSSVIQLWEKSPQETSGSG